MKLLFLRPLYKKGLLFLKEYRLIKKDHLILVLQIIVEVTLGMSVRKHVTYLVGMDNKGILDIRGLNLGKKSNYGDF